MATIENEYLIEKIASREAWKQSRVRIMIIDAGVDRIQFAAISTLRTHLFSL